MSCLTKEGTKFFGPPTVPLTIPELPNLRIGYRKRVRFFPRKNRAKLIEAEPTNLGHVRRYAFDVNRRLKRPGAHSMSIPYLLYSPSAAAHDSAVLCCLPPALKCWRGVLQPGSAALELGPDRLLRAPWSRQNLPPAVSSHCD